MRGTNFLPDLSRRAWLGAAALAGSSACRRSAVPALDKSFLIATSELRLEFGREGGARALSFAKHASTPAEWRKKCQAKLRELLGLGEATSGEVRELRRIEHARVVWRALVMETGPNLSLPAYLLEPAGGASRSPVLALHGHGQVEQVIGVYGDYHHRFGLELAQAGHTVLCPELRGFGVLANLSLHREGFRLDYWHYGRDRQFTLLTDAFLYGRTLVGETVADLLGWEEWLCADLGAGELDVAGFSYGGDLAISYAAFSRRVRRVFASGSFGSFALIFPRCYNAPAHCIPGILDWMDRSDIAGLNAPRPVALHYGERDTPGPENFAAAYNESVPQSLAELRAIYREFQADDAVQVFVTPNMRHEIDVGALRSFLD